MKILRPPKGSFPLSLSVILALSGLSGFASGQIILETQKDEPFAYWSMNERGPGAANNLGTSAAERASFPAGNTQTEFGVPGLADPNLPAVRFNGWDADAGMGGFMSMADSADSNAGGPWLAKTISLWFSVDDADSDTEQVLYEQGGSTRGMAMYVRGGDVFVGAHNSSEQGPGAWGGGTALGVDSELVFAKTAIESNTPYHLAMVYEGDDDGFDGTITLFLNGEEKDSGTGAGQLFAHTDDIRIGGVAAQSHFDPDFSGENPFGNDGALQDPPVQAQSPYFFKGVIDDVALFDAALSGERLKAHFDSREYIGGDFDDNGTVDNADLQILLANFNTEGSYLQGDVDFSGQIDIDDWVIFRAAFNAPASCRSRS